MHWITYFFWQTHTFIGNSTDTSSEAYVVDGEHYNVIKVIGFYYAYFSPHH